MSDHNPDTVVISRTDYDIGYRSTALLQKLLNNPKHAPKIEEAIAEVNPQATFPGRDAREAAMAPFKAELESERTKREALEARLNARDEKDAADIQTRQESDLLAKMTAIRSKRGFSDDMMDKVVARMREQNNPDIDAAAAYIAESIPRSAPIAGHDYLPSTVDNYGLASRDEAWKGLHENPDQWQTKELRDIVRDPEFLRLGNQ